MATIVVSLKTKGAARADARVLAAEVAWALSAMGFDTTLSGGLDWPAVDSNGTEGVVGRFESLAAVVGRRHEIQVEVAR